MENNCKFVSSYGIIFSTSIHNNNPISSVMHDLDISNLQEGDSIYICNTSLRYFYYNILPKITKKFVLVSGDSDDTMPYSILLINEYLNLVNNNLLIKWFCQNFIGKHDKVIQMPIGTDYHSIYRKHEIMRGLYLEPYAQEQNIFELIKNAKHFSVYINGANL
jgi:hypothetical protein